MATVPSFDYSYTPEERIARAKVKLYTQAPFFSYLLGHLTTFEEPNIGTMGVNGKNQMFYNAEFITKLADEVLMGVLCHEVMHCALEHPFRGEGRSITLNSPSGPVSLWNLAIDIVVNAIIRKNGFQLPKEGIIPDIQADSIEMFGKIIINLGDKTAEEIYDEMLQSIKEELKKQQRKGPKGNGGKCQNPGEGGTTICDYDGELGFDKHDFEDAEGGDKEGEGTGSGGKGDKGEKETGGMPKNKKWSDVMAEATTYSQQRGINPAGLGRDYDILTKSHINWKAILRREIARSIPYDYTWSRPSRKFMSQNIYMPSTVCEETRCLFFVDLSGSVGREDMSAYMTEIYAVACAFASVEMRIITHDAAVCDDFHITSATKQKLLSLECHGGGGTDMVCVHEYIKGKGYNKSYAIGFHMTDGFGSFPEKPAVPSYILLSKNHCEKSTLPQWAKGIIPIE